MLFRSKCLKDEKYVDLFKADKQLIYKCLGELEDCFKKDYQFSINSAYKKDPVIVKAIKKLISFRKEINNDEDLMLIEKINKALNRGIPDEAIRDLRKLERTKIEGIEYLNGLIKIYNQYRLGELKYTEKDEEKYIPTELICCEVLK